MTFIFFPSYSIYNLLNNMELPTGNIVAQMLHILLKLNL
jgi:hypothetical protein